jgi:hypothetical protein
MADNGGVLMAVGDVCQSIVRWSAGCQTYSAGSLLGLGVGAAVSGSNSSGGDRAVLEPPGHLCIHHCRLVHQP